MASWPMDPRRSTEWTRAWMDVVSSTVSAAGGPTAPRLAIGPVGMVLDLLADRMVGRRATYCIGGRDLTLSLDEVTSEGSELPRSVGQYGTVRIRAHEVDTAQGVVDSLQIEARNVHLRPGAVPAVIAAPIYWRVELSATAVQEWLARHEPRVDVALGETGPVVGFARRLRWARLEVHPVAEGQSVRVVPRRLRLGRRQIGLRLPGYNIALPTLPHHSTLTNIDMRADGVTVHGLVPEWHRSLERGDLGRLLAALKTGAARVDL